MTNLLKLCVGAMLAVAVIAPATLAQTPTVLGTAQYSADPDLRCELLEVKRVSGGALIVAWRLVNGSAQPGGLTPERGKRVNYNFSWEELYFIDPAENKKYQFLTDSGGNRILDVFHGNFEPGQQRLNWAKFPAPPASSTKISISLPKFRPFDDIPISQ